MKMLIRFFQRLYFVYATALFALIVLLIFPVSLVAVPFGRVRGGNIILRVASAWADLWFVLVFIRQKNIYEVSLDRSRSYIFVGNHNSYFDAIVLLKALKSNFRALGRAETAAVPIFGYIYKNAIVTVDRSSPENRKKSVEHLISFIRKGISVAVFPEGTFNMSTNPLKDFYDGAFRVAIETQTPIKPFLILNSFNIMHYSSVFSLSPGSNSVVFLEEISVEGFTMDSLPALKQKVYNLMQEGLIKYNAPWIK